MNDAVKQQYHLSDDASDFVNLTEWMPEVIPEIRYYTSYNFIGERIHGYEEPVALMTSEAAQALKKAAESLGKQGYVLKIWDAYRPQTAVDHFVSWAEDIHDIRMKESFYPGLDKSELFAEGFIAAHSGHSRGSTVDLTLVDMKTGREADMGGPFDWFGEISHSESTAVTEEQYQNRMILQKAMIQAGFVPLMEEWWHFTLKDEPYPDTYFTFPVSASSLKHRGE